jgi:restriction system protein
MLRCLSELVPPTDFEASTHPNRLSVRRYSAIVRFSTIGAVKAGWLIKNKGAWSLTDDGSTALGKFSAPGAFCRETSRLHRKWRSDQPTDVPDLEFDE